MPNAAPLSPTELLRQIVGQQEDPLFFELCWIVITMRLAVTSRQRWRNWVEAIAQHGHAIPISDAVGRANYQPLTEPEAQQAKRAIVAQTAFLSGVNSVEFIQFTQQNLEFFRLNFTEAIKVLKACVPSS